jgi:hypothetical protein
MSTSVKVFLESISQLATTNGANGTPIQLANLAAQEALANLDLRVSQFEENLQNPLPAYLFDGQTAILKDLKRKRDALIAGAISVDVALSTEPLPAEPVADPLLTEVLAQAVATPSTVNGTPLVADPVAEIPEASDVNAPPIDSEWLATLVTRIRATVVEQVVAEAAKLVIAAKRDALREAIFQVKREMQNAK